MPLYSFFLSLCLHLVSSHHWLSHTASKISLWTHLEDTYMYTTLHNKFKKPPNHCGRVSHANKATTKQNKPGILTAMCGFCFQRQFGGQSGCWCQQKTTLPILNPQQTYYAAVGVKGERLEARGRVRSCRGGGLPLDDDSLPHPYTSCPWRIHTYADIHA